MRNFVKFGAAAIVALGCASLAQAQDVDASVSAETAVDTSATTNAGGDVSMGSLITRLQGNASGSSSIDFTAMGADTQVKCVSVTSLQNSAGADQMSLDEAIGDRTHATTSLWAGISGNADLMSNIEASCASAGLDKFDVNSVLDVDNSANGQLIVYVDDRTS